GRRSNSTGDTDLPGPLHRVGGAVGGAAAVAHHSATSLECAGCGAPALCRRKRSGAAVGRIGRLRTGGHRWGNLPLSTARLRAAGPDGPIGRNLCAVAGGGDKSDPRARYDPAKIRRWPLAFSLIVLTANFKKRRRGPEPSPIGRRRIKMPGIGGITWLTDSGLCNNLRQRAEKDIESNRGHAWAIWSWVF